MEKFCLDWADALTPQMHVDRCSNTLIKLLLKIENCPHHLLYKDSGSKLCIIQFSNYLIRESVTNEKVNVLLFLSNQLDKMFEKHSKRKKSTGIETVCNIHPSKDPVYSNFTCMMQRI